MSPSHWYWEDRTANYISYIFDVKGSGTPGYLHRSNAGYSTGGVRPEFLLGIGEFIGNYSGTNFRETNIIQVYKTKI